MAIYGIGSDIVETQRIRVLWERYGKRFARRILSTYELEKYQSVVDPVMFLSKRFAAKEAIAKALGTGFREQVFLTEVGVETGPLGKPQVCFYGTTQQYVQEKLVSYNAHITISDEKKYVLAFAVIEQSK